MEGGEDSLDRLHVNGLAVSNSITATNDNAETSASRTEVLRAPIEKGQQKANEARMNESDASKKRPHNSIYHYATSISFVVTIVGICDCSLSKGLEEGGDNGGKKKLKAPKNVAKQWKSLPEEEKRPFQDAVKHAWKNHAKERGDHLEARKKAYLDSRCSLKRFAAVVKMLDQDQIRAVNAHGLGGLLHIKKQKRKFQVIEDLAARFDIQTRELEVHGGRLNLTPGEVECLLGLPSTGLSVEQFIGNDESVRMTYNLGSDRIHAGKLGDSLASIPAGHEFQAKFLSYAIATVIRPSTSVYVSPSCFGILKNLSVVCALNWAKYALDGHVGGIKKYRESDSAPSKPKRLTWCLLILEIFYLQHVHAGQIKLPKRRALAPRIRDWDEDAKSLVFEMMHQLGGMDSDKVELVTRCVSAPTSMTSYGVRLRRLENLQNCVKIWQSLERMLCFTWRKCVLTWRNLRSLSCQQ